MKKKLTALFLTAALALTSMAAVIPAAAAAPVENEPDPIEIDVDLMPLASTSATKVNVEDGNGYLHLYDRHHNYSNPAANGTPRVDNNLITGIGWQPASGYLWNNKVVYYVSLKARIANNWASQAEAKNTNSSFADDATSMYFKMYAGGDFYIFDLFKTSIDGVAHTVAGSNKGVNIAPVQFIDTAKLAGLHSNLGLSLPYVPAVSYSYKPDANNVGIALTNEWTTLVYAFVPRFGDNTVGAGNKNYFIAFSSVEGAHRNLPVDIDDFEVWYYENGTKVPFASFNFDNIENPTHVYEWQPANRYDKFFAVNGRAGYNRHFKVSNIKEYDYVEVAAPVVNGSKQAIKEGTIGYNFGEGVKLDAGVYKLTAEARLNFYDGYLDDTDAATNYTPVLHPQFIANEDNKAKLEIKDNYGNSWGKNDVASEWSKVEYTLIVPKGADFTLTDINAVFTDDTASVNKAFDLRNVKLVKTETFIYDEEYTASRADVVYTIEDDAFIPAGASEAKVERVYPDSYTAGNRYLTVSGRTNERDGFILDLRGIVDNSEANNYRLRFKVRASNELSNTGRTNKLGDTAETMIRLSAGLYRGKYVAQTPSYFSFKEDGLNSSYYQGGNSQWFQFGNNNNNHKESNGNYITATWYDEDTTWRIIDVWFNSFHCDEEGVDTRYNVIHFGGSESAIHTANFDIDDIIIYENKDNFVAYTDNYNPDVDEIIWSQNFQSERVGELSKSLSATFVPFKETLLPNSLRSRDVGLEVVEDAPYFTATGVNQLNYTVPEFSKITLDPGVYSIHADLSYPYFDGSRLAVGLGGSKNRNYVKENTNKFDVTAIVETENDSDGVVKNVLNTVTVGNSWERCEFKFKVNEETVVKSVTFVITDASGAQYTTVCYRNIYIDGSYPAGPGRPDPGITMVLLYKKMLALTVEADLAEADADRALSKAEVVYPIIDGDFKALVEGRASKVKSEYPGSFEKGNKYLRVNGRGNNRDGLILDLRRAVLDVSEEEYRLSFKIRSVSKVMDIWANSPASGPYTQKDVLRLGEGLYNGAYTPASPTVFSKATINSAGFDSSANGWYFDNNAWTVVDVSFKELKDQNVIHIGGGSLGCHCSDFDIDDIKIYVKGEAEPIYLEDFEDEKSGALSTNLSYFYVPFQNGNVPKSYRTFDVALEVDEDLDYVTTGGADELKYTAEVGEMSLKAGKYTLHADFSYPYFDGKRIELAQTNDSKKQNYFRSNTNTFDVTAVIETDNGTLTFDSYAVRSGWTVCEFGFDIEEDTEIKSVSFKITPADGTKSAAVNLRRAYIDGNLAK